MPKDIGTLMSEEIKKANWPRVEELSRNSEFNPSRTSFTYKEHTFKVMDYLKGVADRGIPGAKDAYREIISRGRYK
jgi:hypothetical protein